MGPPQGPRRRGLLLDTNILVYYQLPAGVAAGEGDRVLARLATSIVDGLGECGPLVVTEVLVDELRNALRDRLVAAGVSRAAKVRSALRLVEDFRLLLESLARAGLASRVEEDDELYREAHWALERARTHCRGRLEARRLRSLGRDALHVAAARRLGAVLVTRDHNLYDAMACLHATGHGLVDAVLVRVEEERRTLAIEACPPPPPSCLLDRARAAAEEHGWTLRTHGCRGHPTSS